MNDEQLLTLADLQAFLEGTVGGKGGSNFHRQLRLLPVGICHQLSRSATGSCFAPLPCDSFDAVDKSGISQRLALIQRYAYIANRLGIQFCSE